MLRKVGIIGFGNMGEALVRGLKEKDPGIEIGVIEKISGRRELAVKVHGAKDFTGSFAGFFSFAEITVVAIKPQDLESLLDAMAPHVGENTAIVSIIAGKTIASFERKLATRKICRFMPNLAAAYGRAFVGVTLPEHADEEFRRSCLAVAEALGVAGEIPESLMPAVTGLSGSGIAYVFSFLHAMALGGTKSGIPYDKSLGIALTLLEGAVEVVRKTGEHPMSLLSRVISPAGTTIEGVMALEEGGFTASVMDAVERATNRARDFEA